MLVNNLQLANIPGDITNLIVTQYLGNDFKSLGRLRITCKNNNAKLKDFTDDLYDKTYDKIKNKVKYLEYLIFFKKYSLLMLVENNYINGNYNKAIKSEKCT